MRKNILGFLLLCLFILYSRTIVFAGELAWENIGKEILEVNTVLVDRLNPEYICVGNRRGVHRSKDEGKSWNLDTHLNKRINFLLQDNQGAVYAATVSGLFITLDQGTNWKRIFRGRNSEENNCLTLAILQPDIIYLGTTSGLFISKDRGKTWHKQNGELGSLSVFSLVPDAKNRLVYAVGANKVFKIQDGLDYYQEIFTKGLKSTNPSEEENSEELTSNPRINYVAVDPNIPSRVYLATDSGVYLSQDEGLTWNLISDFGMLSHEVKSIFLSRYSDLYAVTKSGIFLYQKERWRELSLRLPVSDIRFLAFDNQDNLYAATDKGLFRTREINLSSNLKENPPYFKNEPTIQELHQAAIRYAQVVDPRRIENLRREARVKAILPELSVGIDRHTTDLWHWEGGSTTKADDDILRKGHDSVEWDVSLTWSLSDLIWSEQQRLIDGQVRLMVELRNDILDEVNKIYFERRRVKIELANLSYQDERKLWEKKIKLEELTASLDALTGGYFSQHLKN